MIKKTLGLLTVLLGFIGFSFATKYELNQPTAIYNLGADAIFTFTNGVNFNLNSQYYNILINGDYNYKYNMFWSNTGLYFVYSYNWGATDLKQGYFKKFCRTTYNNVCNGSTNPTWINVDEFFGDSNYTNADYLDIYAVQYGLSFCFGYESLNQSICFTMNPYRQDENSAFGGSLGITRNPNFSDLPNDSIKNYFTLSPFSNSSNNPVIPDYTIGTGRQLRNYEVLMGFEYMGLSKEYCYGGFDIDNIFLPSEQFSDFSGYSFGSGATLFDLYNSYGGGLTIKSFLSNYYQSFLNSQLSNFHNKSKALLMIFQQYQSANDREWGSFKLNDLMDYCDLYFNLKNNNRENDGDIYTGNSQNAINSYQLNRKIPEGGFTNTGVLINGTGFSSADEFFGRLTNLFQSGVNGVEGTFPPMIPSYIVAFMLAIILIRIISH